jgi:hypothetical protein
LGHHVLFPPSIVTTRIVNVHNFTRDNLTVLPSRPLRLTKPPALLPNVLRVQRCQRPRLRKLVSIPAIRSYPQLFTKTHDIDRVILYSSFTPFIVIFLHAIASSSLEDTQLLEDVVRTLYPVKDTSKACGRLYQICTNFARVARGLIESRASSFLGTYNRQDDSLLLLSDTGNTSVFDPNSLQDYFTTEVDMLDQFTYSEAEGMSAILGGWASGQPAPVEFLGMGSGTGNWMG